MDPETFFRKLMEHLCTYLGTKRKAEFAVSLMMPSGEPDELAARYVVPRDSEFVRGDVRLSMMESAAGTAQSSKVGLYIPSIKRRAAVSLGKWEWVGVVFAPAKEEGDGKRAKSMICLPLVQMRWRSER